MSDTTQYKVYHCEFNGRLIGSVDAMKEYKIQVHCQVQHILPILYSHYQNVVLLRVWDEQNNELEVRRSSLSNSGIKFRIALRYVSYVKQQSNSKQSYSNNNTIIYCDFINNVIQDYNYESKLTR